MFKKFDTSYVGFMADGAKWLVENTDIKLVGKTKNFSVVYIFFGYLRVNPLKFS